MIRYANIHILHTVPFSNPNRDDTGAPKTTTFGGVLRGRMSSQSLKRAARIAFEADSTADLTKRSKYADDQLRCRTRQVLTAAGITLDDAAQAELNKTIEDEIKKLTGKAESAKDTLVWIAEAETNALAAALAAKAADQADVTLDKAIIDSVLSGATASLTIAGFGRMFANRADLHMEAAVQVGHAFTTHSQQIDLDYFTAFDDLQASFDEPDADGNVKGAGAGHLDINQFHSGVFYRYFNINRDDLAANWAALNAGDASDRLQAFLSAMINELPTGRDAVAAHQTVPDFVMVTFGTRGTSYAPAFERPVGAHRDSGYLAPSVDALTSYADKVRRSIGQDHRIVVDLNADNGPSLNDLTGQVARWIATGDIPTTVGAAG